jgi:hypothetical protein
LDLIGQLEYDDSDVQIISPEITQFRCGWLVCSVTRDTMQFSTSNEEEFERLRDAMVGVLRILENTPIAAMGINRFVHFGIETPERWHSVGDTLVPKNYWEDVLILPGLRNLTLYGVRPDKQAGRIQIAIEPSNRMPHGIEVTHNDHYDLRLVDSQPTDRDLAFITTTETAESASPDKIAIALDILRSDFQSSIDRSNRLIDHVYKVGA